MQTNVRFRCFLSIGIEVNIIIASFFSRIEKYFTNHSVKKYANFFDKINHSQHYTFQKSLVVIWYLKIAKSEAEHEGHPSVFRE